MHAHYVLISSLSECNCEYGEVIRQVIRMLTFSFGVNQLLQLESVLSDTRFSGVRIKGTSSWQQLAIRLRWQTGKSKV